MTPNVADFTLWQRDTGELEAVCPICGRGTDVYVAPLQTAVTIRDLIAAASEHARLDHPVTERRTA